ncbi:hypothetical protein ACFL7E_08680 [Thermodesulfobacteriota bacterium]
MSEFKIDLTGWKAIVVVAVLIGVIGARLMIFNDKKDDKALMREIEVLLIGDYLPDDAEKLRAVYETGDRDEIERVAKSIASTKLNVDSVQVSYPLFDFSSAKKVVIKVRCSLNDASGTREKRTKYYRFKHSSLGNFWQYKYESSAVSYYLNFI